MLEDLGECDLHLKRSDVLVELPGSGYCDVVPRLHVLVIGAHNLPQGALKGAKCTVHCGAQTYSTARSQNNRNPTFEEEFVFAAADLAERQE